MAPKNANAKKKKKAGSESDPEEIQEDPPSNPQDQGTSASAPYHRDSNADRVKTRFGSQHHDDVQVPGTSNTQPSGHSFHNQAKAATSLIRRETATLPVESGPQTVEGGALKYPLSMSTQEERRSVQPILAARISHTPVNTHDNRHSSIHSGAINTYVNISRLSRSKESVQTLNVDKRDPYYYIKGGEIPVHDSDPGTILCCNRFRFRNFLKDIQVLRIFAIIWGVIEVLGALSFTILIFIFSSDLERLYHPSDAMVIALLCATIALLISGIILIVAVLIKLKALTWTYITFSTLLCMYMFVMSIIMIHHALINLERDVKSMIATKAGDSYFLFSDGVLMGFIAMTSSVIHFIGNILVCIFYNIRYVQPLLLNKS